MEITGIKNRIKKEQKPSRTYLYYTFLFGFLYLGVFFIFLKSGKSFIWNVDGAKQHYAILYHFHHIIKNIFTNGFPMISWNMGLGLDTIGQYSYYVLGDPFAYISLLFPVAYLEIAYHVLIIARIYCVGLAFIAYCRYCNKKVINTLLGTLIYTFCGFVLYAGVRHPYFLNAVILLPLNLLGIEKLLKEHKKGFLTFIVFVTALVNYYFFYMITIINLLYALTKYVIEYYAGVREFWKKLASAVLCYLVGVLMASVILLPTVYTFLNSARTGCVQPKEYMAIFYQFFCVGMVCMRFKNWTVISVASIVILMLPILLTKWKDKEARSYFILFIVTTVMILLPQAASMMNGFSFPSNRWVFAYAFILAYIVTICFDSTLVYSTKQKWSMLFTVGVYAVLGAWILHGNIKQNMDFYAVIFIALTIWGIIAYPFKQRHYAIAAIFILTGINIIVNAYALYSPLGKGYANEFIDQGQIGPLYATVDGKIEHYKEAIEYIKSIDSSFYRISKSDTKYQNLSMFYDYHPIELYLSLGNRHVFNLSKSLDDRCYTQTRCVNGVDRRTKIGTLLGNKYFICDKNDQQYVPYGYELFYEIENTQIYRNKYYLPIGIVYHSYITQEEYNTLSPLEKEDALLTTAMVENNIKGVERKEDLKKTIQSPISLPYHIKEDKVKGHIVTTHKKNDNVILEIDKIPTNAELYIYIPNIKYKGREKNTDFKVTAEFNKVSVNEEVKNCFTSAYYMENDNFLINLGITDNITSNRLVLTFNKKGRYTFDSLEVLAVPMQDYQEKVKKLTTMENTEYGNNYISGEVTTKQDGILQITTSYSDGWKAYVDGKETELLKVNEAFIGCKVEAGTHKIKFKYTTPYLKVGAICSAAGMVLFNFVLWRERRI